MSLNRASLAAVAVCLAACSSLPRAPRPTQLYDLGLAPQAVAEDSLVGAIQVAAPSWLRSSAMQYRLSYASASERHSYLESRWAAPPTELVHGLLTRSLGGTGACRLELDLDEFMQDHASPGHSDGVIEARARLRGEGGIVARRNFSLRLPAATPDAPGGVAALNRGARQLAGELASWLAELARELPIREGCAGT